MTDAVTRSDHELVPFAVFLEYRARRMRAPVVEGEVPAPTPADPTPPEDRALAKVAPLTPDA